MRFDRNNAKNQRKQTSESIGKDNRKSQMEKSKVQNLKSPTTQNDKI